MNTEKNQKSILIINGPNLNLLGTREPSIYGTTTMDDYLQQLHTRYPQVLFDYYQSNIEGELVTRIQEGDVNYDGIVLNAAAFSHTSIAILDAVRAIHTPVIEVHISNIFGRESFRNVSLISPACAGIICGFGLDSYRLAIEALLELSSRS